MTERWHPAPIIQICLGRDSLAIGRSVLRVTRSLPVCAAFDGATSCDDRFFPD
jgi:hypothetical protein